ncbi:MAG: aminoglycoside phosphotransferase family protein [Chloroflexales bacterium]|nr:aminoglycoside phosphotransferase family protein [Chloroflexales bacterium]
MDYDFLNNYAIDPDDPTYSDAWRRVLGRLGDYTAFILRSLNMRPTDIVLLDQTPVHVRVRVSTPTMHLVLRIAPEGDLSGAVYFGRVMATHQFPAARIIHADMTCSLVPFTYIVEGHVCGTNVDLIDSSHLVRAAARQTGRLLRRMHRISAAGWGRPNRNGRWTFPDWRAVLASLHAMLASASLEALLFDETERATIATLLDHPALVVTEPRLMHGAPSPRVTLCTVGEHVQLEALTNPGWAVAGDGLLDLAWGLNPVFRPEWRMGLLEGYNALATLSAAETERLRLLRLLTCYWHTCQSYARVEPFEAIRAETLALFAEMNADPNDSLSN